MIPSHVKYVWADEINLENWREYNITENYLLLLEKVHFSQAAFFSRS
jgi:hypothetical protein